MDDRLDLARPGRAADPVCTWSTTDDDVRRSLDALRRVVAACPVV